MKYSKFLSFFACASLTCSAFAATIDGLTPAYSKDGTTYTGSNGDSLTITTPSDMNLSGSGSWTIALTISGLQTTTDSEIGLLFTYNTSTYYNIEGLGYQLTNEGQLTICSGGFNYGGSGSGTSPFSTAILTSAYDASQPLSLFYTYENGKVAVSAVCGAGGTVTSLTIGTEGVSFSSNNVTKINFSQKDTSGNTWSAPNGVAGVYTLQHADVYTSVLTNDQMIAYSVPEPATATLSLLGLSSLFLRRRRG
jgi:hypothetical protein